MSTGQGTGMTWLAKRAGLETDAPPDVVGPALLGAVRDTLDLASRAMSADPVARDDAQREALIWQQELDDARADSSPYLSRVAAGLRDAAERLARQG